MCLSPREIIVTRYSDKLTGEIINFDKKTMDPFNFDIIGEKITVHCGKCVECLAQQSKEWSFRISQEAKNYEKNCFLTLTYDNDHLPLSESGLPTLKKRDLQLFLKRLRRHLEPSKIRFFACGEYGAKGHRPHYHLIVFGWCPDDKTFLQVDKKKQVLYNSAFVSNLWQNGFISVGDVNEDTAKYCAKYMQKLNKVDSSCVPSFTQMSRRPGIGFDSVTPRMLESDKIFIKGVGIKVPRYYLRVLESRGYDLTEFMERRKKQGELTCKNGSVRQRMAISKDFKKKKSINFSKVY